MRVLALTPPGRFPSVALDTGLWWDRVAAGGRHELLRFSANYAWWRVICSERFKKLALEPLSAIDRVKRRAEWRAQGIALAEDAKAASRSLDYDTNPAIVPLRRRLYCAVYPDWRPICPRSTGLRPSSGSASPTVRQCTN